jgi:hypothetical protein
MIAAAITPNTVKQRRPKKEENKADLHNYLYHFNLQIPVYWHVGGDRNVILQ